MSNKCLGLKRFLQGSVFEALIRIATVWKNGVGRKVGPFFMSANPETASPCTSTPRSPPPPPA